MPSKLHCHKRVNGRDRERGASEQQLETLAVLLEFHKVCSPLVGPFQYWPYWPIFLGVDR